MPAYDYDLFVIGAGSGGVRAARLAAAEGARVGIAEEYRIGGTCVIRGCVPKKLFVYASKFAGEFEDAVGFGWTTGEPQFDWSTLLANKDAEIARLSGLYRQNLDRHKVDIFERRAEFEDAHTLCLLGLDRKITAERILIATGASPFAKVGFEGEELAITSNEAFHLPTLPKSIMIKGGGYIAVEFAGIFNGLGVDTTLIYRGDKILRGFDDDLRDMLQEEMVKKGIKLQLNDEIAVLNRGPGGISGLTKAGSRIEVEQVMLATGRTPHTHGLGLDKAGVEIGHNNCVKVDAYSQTSQDHIYAVGDVTDRVSLTPVAIREGSAFVETVYKGNPTAVEHHNIPTAVFSQPEIGTVGLTETRARATFKNLNIWRAKFRPMIHTLSGRDEKMLMKMIVDADTDTVVGLHLMGPDSGELAQLAGVLIKMGAKKSDFDATIAIHPTAAEELVTLKEPDEIVRDPG